MKDAIIAKLANQAADFYSDAFKQCQYKENLPKVGPDPPPSVTKSPQTFTGPRTLQMGGTKRAL